MTRNTAISAVAAIDDPLRQRLFRLVSASAHPVTREWVGESLGLSRSTVAFHLDRLVEAGLLTVQFERVNGKTGPGAGRPSKTYAPTAGEVTVSIPERRYDLMGTLLASAIEATPAGRSAVDALREVADAAGRTAGATAGNLERVLDETGYEPVETPDGTVLTNCPFHRLADSHRDVVCAANHSFLCGAAEATGTDVNRVLLEPTPGGCCVRIAAESSGD